MLLLVCPTVTFLQHRFSLPTDLVPIVMFRSVLLITYRLDPLFHLSMYPVHFCLLLWCIQLSQSSQLLSISWSPTTSHCAVLKEWSVALNTVSLAYVEACKCEHTHTNMHMCQMSVCICQQSQMPTLFLLPFFVCFLGYLFYKNSYS